jgi:hypothetical protein
LLFLFLSLFGTEGQHEEHEDSDVQSDGESDRGYARPTELGARLFFVY